MQLSSVIGKPVLSAAGENFGYVLDARLARGFLRVSCLVCADDEEEEFYIPGRAVLSVEDAVIASRARLDTPTGQPSPIGKEAYTNTGEYLGAVCDVLLGDGAEAVLIIVKEGVRTTAPVSYASVSRHVIVYPDASAKAQAAKKSPSRPASPSPRPKKPRPEKPAPLPPKIVKIVRPEQPVPAPAAQNEAPMPAKPPQERSTVYLLNNTNLLGRRVKRSVFDEQGLPVAIAGERITPAVLSRARRSNRLLELTVNTLTVQY